MSSVNRRIRETTNSVGTPVNKISDENTLTRLTLACMLFEDQFYLDGKAHSALLKELVAKCDPEFTANLAVKARSEFKLRHVPLLLTRELARRGALKAATLTDVIQRPDEMGEFVSHYWSDKKQPLSNQVKKGLAACFNKFNEYSLAKWDKNSAAIRVRDVMFLTHAKPANPAQEELFKRIADDKLVTPDTWEVALSGGADKRETFIRLMAEKKLGALAFLRNLRNMENAGISKTTISDYAIGLDVSKVLPFRFIAAYRAAPSFKPMLETLMLKALASMPKLPGRTVLVVDISGSMGTMVSGKSDLSRLDAAAALAILAREICEDVVIYATAGYDSSCRHATTKLDHNKLRGFALADTITGVELRRLIGGGGIFLVQAMDFIAKSELGKHVDRTIVFTDEQDTGGRGFEPDKAVRLTDSRNYIVNVGSYTNGINSGAWHTVTGFSEAVLTYIRACEETFLF